MAIIAEDWVPVALVRFGGLCFNVNSEGGLERICSSDCSLDTNGAYSVVDSLRGLWLDALGASTFPQDHRLLTSGAREGRRLPR